MRNKLIKIVSFPLALGFHLYLKYEEKRAIKKREKAIDDFFKINDNLSRYGGY